MSRYALAGLLALPALLASSNAVQAQCLTCLAFGKFIHQHGPYYNYSAAGGGYGCGAGYGCYSGGNHAHMSRGGFGDGHGLFHGGLFGHGNSCGTGGCGHSGWGHGGGWGYGGGFFHGGGGGGLFHHGCNSCGHGGWGHYALSTFRNVFHRCHPCGGGRSWGHGYATGNTGGCSNCGTTATPAAAQPATLPTK